jgi:hypothetical protein
MVETLIVLLLLVAIGVQCYTGNVEMPEFRIVAPLTVLYGCKFSSLMFKATVANWRRCTCRKGFVSTGPLNSSRPIMMKLFSLNTAYPSREDRAFSKISPFLWWCILRLAVDTSSHLSLFGPKYRCCIFVTELLYASFKLKLRIIKK